MYYELQPAYGRDYKTKADVIKAFNEGHDFVGDYQMGFRYCNKHQIQKGTKVLLRYKKNTQVAVTTV